MLDMLDTLDTLDMLDMLDMLNTLDMLDILRDASSSVLHDPNIFMYCRTNMLLIVIYRAMLKWMLCKYL